MVSRRFWSLCLSRLGDFLLFVDFLCDEAKEEARFGKYRDAKNVSRHCLCSSLTCLRS